MTDTEHELIQRLVMNHKTISRTVREIPGGVETVTTTSDSELVAVLREHVRRMAARVSAGQPVRLWDPVFRDVFRHAEDIRTEIKDTPDGLTVTQTTEKPEVVAIIRAHARAVSNFAEQGAVAVRPPWAGRGRS